MFDARGRLLEWNSGFAAEFPDADLVAGMTTAQIIEAGIVPRRALRLELTSDGGSGVQAVTEISYLNNRRPVRVTVERGAAGGIVRVALSGQQQTLHPGLSDHAEDLLRSSALAMSNAVLVRRTQEEDALRAARAQAEAANRELTAMARYNEALMLNSPLPMAVFGDDGRCLQANEAFAGLLGVARASLLNSDFDTNASWRRAGLHEACRIALRTAEIQRREVALDTAYGARAWVEGRFLPIWIEGRQRLLAQLIDLTERKRHEQELGRLAYTDPLTQLPNRRLLLDRLEQAQQESAEQGFFGAVLFVDLDRFKMVNDTHGHLAGDQLLKAVANRLVGAVRGGDTVARLGGDEFIVLLTELSNDEVAARHRAQQFIASIQASLEDEYRLGEVRFRCSASVGMVLFADDSVSTEQLITDADEAMYSSKREILLEIGQVPGVLRHGGSPD